MKLKDYERLFNTFMDVLDYMESVVDEDPHAFDYDLARSIRYAKDLSGRNRRITWKAVLKETDKLGYDHKIFWSDLNPDLGMELTGNTIIDTATELLVLAEDCYDLKSDHQYIRDLLTGNISGVDGIMDSLEFNELMKGYY